MGETKIEWADATWNPVTGCTPVSEGCQHCYARRMAQRLAGRYGYPADEPFRVAVHNDHWDDPLRWRKPRRVFVCSMGDLFHEHYLDAFRDRAFATMALCPQHTFLCLTKRPARMLEYIATEGRPRLIETASGRFAWLGSHKNWEKDSARAGWIPRWPLPNVWLGVSAENQARADERIPLLLQTPAARRFVSIEPMLGPVDLGKANGLPIYWSDEVPIINGPTGEVIGRCQKAQWHRHDGNMQAWLDLVICGAETGPGARPMDIEWARSVREQCVQAGTPLFFKRGSDGSHLLDGRTWEEMPHA